MYIVTGGAGFIGANIVHGLNQRGETDILVVDNLENAAKFKNLRDLKYADYMDKREFREHLLGGSFNEIPLKAVFHEGACSDTMEYDGKYMMDNNFTYSKELLHFCLAGQIPFIYASSAATYGDSTEFIEKPENENPLNVYGYSKLFFDQYCARFHDQAESTVAGLRYFNVYGPREQHKGKMASQAYQLYNQLKDTGFCTLFGGSHGYEDGGHLRDFVWVGDVVDVNLFLADSPTPIKSYFNLGTGKARAFRHKAEILVKLLGKGEIKFREMPEVLKDKYQAFTQADLTKLRATGYDKAFSSLEEGVEQYFNYLEGS